MTHEDDGDAQGCGGLARERLRYFTGRHMSARDFRDADAYHRAMRHLHNRVLHGWGIACGLEVRLHRRPECGVVIRCGLALDCHGREIVVPRALAQRIPWDRLQARVQGQPCAPGEDGEGGGQVLLLCLEYCEEATEKVPVLYGHDACAGAAYEDGRVREGYRLHWHVVDEDDLAEHGWTRHGGCAPGPEPGPCGDDDDGDDDACCLEPRCPRHACVPLALVRGSAANPIIDSAGRRFIGQASDRLAHVCWISWPHGGVVSASQFARASVRFDRALSLPADSHEAGPTGINERTFVMQAGQQREDLDFVMFNDPPHLLADRRTAVFDVVRPHQYINQTIQVTLRCDFILDCHGNPVDGTHLRGQLPTGNGTMGGNFESWFRVVCDDDYKRLTEGGATP